MRLIHMHVFYSMKFITLHSSVNEITIAYYFTAKMTTFCKVKKGYKNTNSDLFVIIHSCHIRWQI